MNKKNLYYFRHFPLNRFNFLSVQGINPELLPRLFIYFFNTPQFAFAPLEEMSTKKKVSA